METEAKKVQIIEYATLAGIQNIDDRLSLKSEKIIDEIWRMSIIGEGSEQSEDVKSVIEMLLDIDNNTTVEQRVVKVALRLTKQIRSATQRMKDARLQNEKDLENSKTILDSLKIKAILEIGKALGKDVGNIEYFDRLADLSKFNQEYFSQIYITISESVKTEHYKEVKAEEFDAYIFSNSTEEAYNKVYKK